MTPDACPICHYSLEGLPAEYTCPECGFAYDEGTWVHETPTNKPIATVAFLASAFVALAMLREFVLGGTPKDLAIFLIFAWMSWRMRKRPQVRLLVSRDVCLEEVNDTLREWRWTDIADVQRTPGWINHLVTITDRDGKKHTFMRTADRAKADAMVTRMRARLQKPSP